MEDKELSAGHLAKLPGFIENAPESLKKLLAIDPDVSDYLGAAAENAANNA